MNMHIIMPFRPLGTGHLTTPNGELRQTEDGRWQMPSGEIREQSREDIERGIFFLRKNSIFKHKILVAIDADVFPNPDFLSEFDNLQIIKSSYTPPLVIPEGKDRSFIPYTRLCAAYRDAIATVPDEEWICYGYTCDLICCEKWDEYIERARQKYGDEHVYVPMFVEMKTQAGSHLEYEIKGTTPTPHQIWVEFRGKVCCHGLTWPEPNKDHLTEEDFNEYIDIARRGHIELGVPDVIFEPCGARSIGYYNVLCMRAKYAKMAGFTMQGLGFDIRFDDDLRDRAHRMKGVVTDSYVYHPQSETYRIPFKWR